MKEIFNNLANEWDTKPRRIETAMKIAEAIKKDKKEGVKILDFGCGTGLLGLNTLCEKDELLGVDNSENMVEEFNKKCEKFNVKNAKAKCLDIFSHNQKYDMIISSMTLHHIENLDLLFQKFYELLNDGGKLFLADLCEEDGTFHDRGNEGVFHFGFSEEQLKNISLNNGFKNFSFEVVHKVKKKKEYELFLMRAEK